MDSIGIPERTIVPSTASLLCWDDRHIPLHSGFQHGSWELKPRISCSHSKHLIDAALSPAPILLFINTEEVTMTLFYLMFFECF